MPVDTPLLGRKVLPAVPRADRRDDPGDHRPSRRPPSRNGNRAPRRRRDPPATPVLSAGEDQEVARAAGPRCPTTSEFGMISAERRPSAPTITSLSSGPGCLASDPDPHTANGGKGPFPAGRSRPGFSLMLPAAGLCSGLQLLRFLLDLPFLEPRKLDDGVFWKGDWIW